MSKPSASGSRRISITKLQRDSAAAVELISLCQSATADGKLSDDEVQSLRQWAQDYSGVDLPARAHIQEVLQRILADGVVTEAERDDLYLAIEAVLPPDLRAPVRGRRREIEETAKAAAKEASVEADAAAREERARNRVLRAWNFMVAGVRHEGRPALIRDHATSDADVFLRRDPGNPFSSNAIAIQLPNGVQVGFVPEVHAVEMAPLLDRGHPYVAFITKILTGGRSPIPVVQADIYRTDSTHPELTRPGSEPDLVAGHGTGRSGCLATIALSVAVATAAGIALT
jgi:hypothetical protein